MSNLGRRRAALQRAGDGARPYEEAAIALTEIQTAPAPFVAEIELLPLRIGGGDLMTVEPPQPAPVPRPFVRRHFLFLVTFVLPVALAAVYLFAIASNRYASQASFLVRSTSSGQEVAGLESLVQSKGTSRATDETFAVIEYLKSRDVLSLLVKNDRLREILASPEADFINRYPNFYSGPNNEWLYWRYLKMVDVQIDSGTGISTIEVSAFRPEDAESLNAALIGYAEAMVNKLNERAYRDALDTANRFVEIAAKELDAAELNLKNHRDLTGIVDPAGETEATLKLIAALSSELARRQAQIQQQEALTPNNPSLAALREQAQSYQSELNRQKALLAGDSASMSNKMTKFDQLKLERDLAVKSMENAVMGRDKAREDSERQHLYVQKITEPNFPDIAKYPRRFIYFFSVMAAAAILYRTLSALRDIALEHKN